MAGHRTTVNVLLTPELEFLQGLVKSGRYQTPAKLCARRCGCLSATTRNATKLFSNPRQNCKATHRNLSAPGRKPKSVDSHFSALTPSTKISLGSIEFHVAAIKWRFLGGKWAVSDIPVVLLEKLAVWEAISTFMANVDPINTIRLGLPSGRFSLIQNSIVPSGSLLRA